ncbi:kinesin-like protein KIN-7I [Citrus sinensis]|uniref:Kinesin-like protein KIN-7I n=1 Tax=Citrus sinensis TaxID=2711 RepID=A0ACB8KWZ4_CITSI|nr:kinesin-like protein KIN-7I [Citrus sinensis]
MGGEEVIPEETQGLSLTAGQEERILVFVRLRPLNEKEYARNDVSDWECINNNSIVFKNSLLERSVYPPAYTFDRVFGCECPTRQVYEEAAKEVTLSVVNGINSTFFAYGQTSSGKTYTMGGITEYAIQDIYDYIDTHQEREFVLKFSAMEIYNESVRDLLSTDSTPLRLLDDPEKGTVVERLTEETLTDMSHLMELLAVCEAQRQIGETALNETSSRSHQILRLTIESSAREYLGAGNSSILSASVNFVDLAGSERASQTLNAGARLKEGSHINRSLLTLGTVIRKLSKGRNAHIPYRDSKLTRILQNSLGGNARTAIICTMSPARSHVEQSRNTLLFASCAKEVATNAQVNVVMSDKALVKQLQKELARLENEMKNLQSTPKKCDFTLLKEKEQVIEEMDRQIRELTKERDLAKSRVDNLLQSIGEEDQRSRLDEYSEVESSDIYNPVHSDVGHETYKTSKNIDNSQLDNSSPNFFHLSENQEDNSLLDNSTPKFVGLDPCQGWDDITRKIDEDSEDTCKEVRCIEMEASTLNRKIESDVGKFPMTGAMEEAAFSPPSQKVRSIVMEESSMERKTGSDVFSPGPEDVFSPGPEDIERRSSMTKATYEASELSPRGDRCIQMEESSINKTTEPDVFLSGTEEEGKLSMTGDIGEVPVTSPQKEDKGSSPVDKHDTEALKQKIQDLQKTISYLVSLYPVEQSPPSSSSDLSSLKMSRSASCKAAIVSMQSSLALEKTENCEDTPTTWSDKNVPEKPGGFNGKLSELKHGPKVRDFDSQTSISAASMEAQSIKEYDADDASSIYEQSENASSLWFEKAETGTDYTEGSMKNAEEAGMDTRKDIIQPLFNWPAEFERQRKEIIELWDACYVPLVHRTYFFLLFKGDPSDSVYMEVELRRLSFLKGGNITKESFNSSLKGLYRERETLSKQVHQKFSRKEREELYKKWGIALNTKQRSLQLARRIWSSTKDMNHIKESASLVAKLIDFVQPGQAPKEIFGLSFSHGPGSKRRRSYSWRPSRRSSMSVL